MKRFKNVIVRIPGRGISEELHLIQNLESLFMKNAFGSNETLC